MLQRRKEKKKTRKGGDKRHTREQDAFIPWKNVSPYDPIAVLAGSDQGGFMSLEEVGGEFYSYFNTDNVECLVGENTGQVPLLDLSTKQKREKKRKQGNEEGQRKEEKKSILVTSSAKTKKRRTEHVAKHEQETSVVKVPPAQTGEALLNGIPDRVSGEDEGPKSDTILDETLLAWAELRLHARIKKALCAMNFTQPTAIQKACIPVAAHQGKDVIGAAETGSGKTLAYVIPILQRLLDEEEKYHEIYDNGELPVGGSSSGISRGPLRALIVTPTRELSLQVCKHFRDAAKYTTIRVIPIVGGISLQKQERLLKQRPQAIVGTPGRLWELMSVGDQHLTQLNRLSFFVLDEADRMVEKGHFQELQSIMSMLPTLDAGAPSHDASQKSLSTSESGITDNTRMVRRQTFVFSATLSLPVDFKKKLKRAHNQLKHQSKGEEYSVALLSQRAGVRANAAIIDLTSQTIVANKLEESTIQCREEEKDFFLYYLLKLHGQGRSIVFCTSIAAVRHVAAILGLLQIQAWPLHAQMQQRQRLKAMDRFQTREDSCLISTDVAARGLDILGVRTVIHYQLPHSAEVYVHRSGRTARASMDGCSIALVTPSEQTKYTSLCSALAKKDGLVSFPYNSTYMPAIKQRVQLAQRIDALVRKSAQTKAKNSWFKRNADALEVDLEDENGEDSGTISHKKASYELKMLHQELRDMLESPLEPKAFSHRFITGAGMSPLLAIQLKDYAKQKAISKQAWTKKGKEKAGLGVEKRRRGLVVIGQEMVEPLAVLQSSKK